MSKTKEASIKTKPSVAEELYNKAIETMDQRVDVYGDFDQSLTHITNYWNVYLMDHGFIHKPLTPKDTSVLLTLFKIARVLKSFDHQDTFVDACNYFTQAYVSRKSDSAESSKQKIVSNLAIKQEVFKSAEALMERLSRTLGLSGQPAKVRENIFTAVVNHIEEEVKNGKTFGKNGNGNADLGNKETAK